MRVTIIVADKAVYKDGVSYSGLDLSFVPEGQRAIQWYDTWGEVEFDSYLQGNVIVKPVNQTISDFSPYSQALVEWQKAYDAEQTVMKDMSDLPDILKLGDLNAA